MDRCYRDFEGIGIKDKDFMMELQRDLLKNFTQSSNTKE